MMKLIETIARATGFRPWVVITAGIVLVLGTGLLAKCGYDRAIVSHAVTKANNKTLKKQAKAHEQSADERLSDAAALSDIQEGFDNAINNPPPGAPASARLRHACQQLLNDGVGKADLPAACGRGSAGGAQAESNAGNRR